MAWHSTQFQVGGDNPIVEGGILLNQYAKQSCILLPLLHFYQIYNTFAIRELIFRLNIILQNFENDQYISLYIGQILSGILRVMPF